VHKDRAAEAQASLAGRLAAFEFQQAPHARLLSSRWLAVCGGADARGVATAVEAVHEHLAEQAKGLPGSLAASLRERPTAWLSNLTPA
jgi:hypothetical protein